MRRTVWVALAVGAATLASTPPAQAQRYRWDFGINGGFSWYSNSLDEDHLFFDEDIDGDLIDDGIINDVEGRFEAGWLVGAQLTYWVPSIFGWEDRLGIRANFAYTERPFEIDVDFDEDLVDQIDLDTEFELEDVNLWSGTGDLLFRFNSPDPDEFDGVEWLPYLALGLGAKWIDPAFNSIAIDDAEGALIEFGDQFFVLEDDTKLMGLVGLGTDIRLARRFALRAEVGDRIWDSPIRALVFDEVIDDFVFFDGDDDVGNVVNELYAQLGLHFLFGLEEREEVVVVPPPAPPPPPAEEMITVCVIDPDTYEIELVSAVFVPSTGDTLVATDAQRVPFETAYPETAPLYVANAGWYVAGEPLTVTVAGMESQWVTYGGARVIEPGDLAFLGTVNGTPVYADAEEVADLMDDLEDAAETDLEDRLEESAEARAAFEEIDVVYVPLETGCVFQPLRRVEEVRKVRG